MAKKPIEVTAMKHDAATRKNIPTAEYESVMREEDKTPVQLAYERRILRDAKVVSRKWWKFEGGVISG